MIDFIKRLLGIGKQSSKSYTSASQYQKPSIKSPKADYQPHYSKVDYSKYFEQAEIDSTSIKLLNLGEVALPSGKVIACDPLVCLGGSITFTKTVAKGNYPVTACIAQTENAGDRYAVVKISFNTQKAIKWELAVTENADTEGLAADEFIGFPVDAGLGCFCDAETQTAYNKFYDVFYKSNPDGNIYDDFFANEFLKNKNPHDPDDIGDWLNFKIPNNEDFNIVMFHSGYGDGIYPCYWGISESNEICCLVVDFFVFADE
jgi:hypothetical protein